MALNMNYASDVLYDVTEVLTAIKERGGMAPNSFLDAEHSRLVGSRASDVLNIALVAMGKRVRYADGKATEAQMETLVARAKKENGLLLSEIAKLREARGK